MNTIHYRRNFKSTFFIFFLSINFAINAFSPATFAYLVREQDGISAQQGTYTQSSDEGFDFVKVAKQDDVTPTSSRQPASSYTVPQRAVAPVKKSLPPPERSSTRTTQPLYKTAEVVTYEPQALPQVTTRKVIHRAKPEEVSTSPQTFIERLNKSQELSPVEQQSQRDRYLDALYLRAEAYYEQREYDACMQTLNSIFMFDPYHVKAQRLRQKVEIKVTRLRSGKAGPSFFERAFGNSEHRKQISLARKLYKQEQYEQVIKICQQIILQDPHNNKAISLIRKSKQKLAAPSQPEIEEPIVEESPRTIEKLAPSVKPVTQEIAPPLQRTVPAVVEPESKDAAQEIALNALMESLQGDGTPAEDTYTAQQAVSAATTARVSPTMIEQPVPTVPREPTLEELAMIARNSLDFDDVDKAQTVLNEMLIKDPGSKLAQEVMNDISVWIQENERFKLEPGSRKEKQAAAAKRTLISAKTAYRNKHYDHALSLYERALQLDPGNSTARSGLIKTRKKQNETIVRGYIDSIKMLHSEQRYDEALTLIDKGLELDARNSRLKKLKKENTKLQRSVSSATTSAREKAPAKKTSRKKQEKKGLFSSLRKKTPLTENELQVQNLLEQAKEAYKKGDYSEAVSRYEEVFKLDPGNKKASKGIDRAREKLILKGRSKDIAEEQRLKDEVEEKVSFYRTMAEKLQRQGKYDSAKVVIQKGLLLAPDDPALRKLDEDNDIFMKKATKVIPDSAGQKLEQEKNALVNKGIKRYLLGDYEEAIKYFNQVLELDPTDAKAQNSITKIQQKLQRLNSGANQ